jgi:RHS repeat-associated protein
MSPLIFPHPRSVVSFCVVLFCLLSFSTIPSSILAQTQNNPPIAVADSFTVHGNTNIYTATLLSNDSDPDGDPLTLGSPVQEGIIVPPSHGTLFGIGGGSTYKPNYGYAGTDSFTYNACDNRGACSSAVVTLNVVNSPPSTGSDSFDVHRRIDIYTYVILSNDPDPDGDPVTLGDPAHEGILVFPSNGSLTGIGGGSTYKPNYGFVGTDSYTYQACDNLGLCASAVVTLNVKNGAPTAGGDFYTANGTTKIYVADILRNDSDPDNDPITLGDVAHESIVEFPTHGSLAGIPGGWNYTPATGYVGADRFRYQICDDLGLCSTATVSILIAEPGDLANAGDGGSCNSAISSWPTTSVGEPVNITNGNMYLQQTDHVLPGPGYAININRFYNSISNRIGLFGRGWSTPYDEALKVFSSTTLRYYSSDGQATYFTRSGSSGPFLPMETDFYGQIIQNADGSYTLTFTNGLSRKFNSSGQLISLTDRIGNITQLNYDAAGKLISIIDPVNRVLNVTSNANGRIISIADSLGTIANYAYGSSQELLNVTYPDGSKYQYTYVGSPNGPVISTVQDALGNILEAHAYDSQGRATTSERHGGVEKYTINYISDTETHVTDALGRVTKYFFDKSRSRNVVTRVEGFCSCGNSQTQTWTYDSRLNVISTTNALNQTTTYTYDADGNVLSTTDQIGTRNFTYNQFGQVLTATDAMGGTTTNTYDSFGNLISMKDALGNTTSFTYDVRGKLLSITDARLNTTNFTYDASGNLIEKKDALNNITKLSYDARGRLTSTTDALNKITSLTYDSVGRITKVTRPDSTSMSFTYDLAGRRIKLTDARNNSTSYEYDGAYRLIKETDAAGKSVSYTYDLVSNLTSQTNQLGQTTNYEYDDFNHMVKAVYPPAASGATRLEERIEYDMLGNVIKRVDASGQTTSFEYDIANRITRTIDSALKVTQYEYNARSNMTALTDAIGQRYTFEYDSLGRITSQTRGGISMSFVYDAVGNRIKRTDYNGITTNYTFDALNRLTKITYPDATTVTYVYDALSRLTTATNINGSVRLNYDNMDRVASTTDVWGQVIGYTYDANGNRTQLKFGTSVNATYQYDVLNRLTTITDNARASVRYTYDAASNIISRSLPNGIATIYQYDGLERLTRLRDAKGTATIADNQYQYNNVGNITQHIDTGGTHTYNYDELNRLTSATYPGRTNENYVYDAVGNRTSSHRSASYGYQPFNKLITAGTASFLYDNNGNMTQKIDSTGTAQYRWDFENRLVQVVRSSGASVSYKYDALGRRIQRSPNSGVSTNFSYDGADVVIDKNSDGTSTEYLNGPGIDNKLRQKSKTATYYFVTDHLGSITALTDTKGKVIEKISYDSFGDSVGSTRTRYGYTQRERDSLTGLIYYRARWYDPQLGRFISEDPIEFAGGANWYAYVNNNPANLIDPFGLYPETIEIPNVGNATAEQQQRFKEAYLDAIKRLQKPKCAKAFGGLKKALKALKKAKFCFKNLGEPYELPAHVYVPPLTNARTEGNNVFINSEGAFMSQKAMIPVRRNPGYFTNPKFNTNTAQVWEGDGLTPKPLPGDIATASFILLHELGHITNKFKPDSKGLDVDFSIKNLGKNNAKIWQPCFGD